MGYAKFIKFTENEVWLYQVATYEDFRNQGIGTVLLDMVNYFAATLNCNLVAGKFKPTSAHVEEFYNKNGYNIVEKEFYLRLEKNIEKDKIISDIKEKYKQEPTAKNNNKKDEIQKLVEENIIKQEYDYTSFTAE